MVTLGEVPSAARRKGSPVLAFPAGRGRCRPQAPDEVGAFIATGCSPSAPTSPLPLHLRAKSRPFGAVALRNAPAGAGALRGGPFVEGWYVLSIPLCHPTFATPLPPSYEEGGLKRLRRFAAQFFIKAAKPHPYSPHPFFGKRGAAAAAGYSSPWSVTDAADNRITAPPRPRRGKKWCVDKPVPKNRTRPRHVSPS